MPRTLIAIGLIMTALLLSSCARSAAGEWTPAKLKKLPEASLLVPQSEVIRRRENTGKAFIPGSALIAVTAKTTATPAEIAKYFDDELRRRGWSGSAFGGFWKKGTLRLSIEIGPEAGMYTVVLEGTEKAK